MSWSLAATLIVVHGFTSSSVRAFICTSITLRVLDSQSDQFWQVINPVDSDDPVESPCPGTCTLDSGLERASAGAVLVPSSAMDFGWRGGPMK